MRKKRGLRSKKDIRLNRLVPLGIVLVVFLTAVFIVKADWPPNNVFASDSSPRAMYEKYLEDYKEALANRVAVAEKAREIYEETVKNYHKWMRDLYKKYACSSSNADCEDDVSPGEMRDFLTKTQNRIVLKEKKRNVVTTGPIAIIDSVWSYFPCQIEDGGNPDDCQKVIASRSIANQIQANKRKALRTWFDNLIRITKPQLSPQLYNSMSKDEAYRILSVLGSHMPIEPEYLDRLQSALNVFRLPNEISSLTTPGMDLLIEWKINADATELANGLGYGGSVYIEKEYNSKKGEYVYTYRYLPSPGDNKNFTFKNDPFGGNKNSIELFRKIQSIISRASFNVMKDIESKS